MLNLRSISAIASVVLALMLAAPAHAQNKTEGRCSPIVLQSMARSITITCPTERADLRPLEALLNTIIARSDASQDQVAELVRLLNGFGGASRTKLGATMTTWLAASLTNLHSAQQGGGYMALVDAADPALGGKPGEMIFFWFAVKDDADAEIRGVSCEAQPDVHVLGFKGSVRRTARGGRQTLAVLRSSDPVLQRICRGLGGPVAALGRPSLQAQGSVTVFDYLSTSQGDLQLVLMPSVIDGVRFDSMPRAFWGAAFVAREFGTTPNFIQGPEFFAALSELEERVQRGEAASVSFDVSVTTSPFSNLHPEEPYGPEVRAEFGTELERMDSAWLQALVGAKVVLHGEAMPLLQAGLPAPILRANGAAQIGSPAFWRQARDSVDYQVQVACIAARFAVERGYVAVGDLPDYGRCGRSFIIE